MRYKKISVLGTGWLGLPLAEMLLREGCDIKGATTSEEKLPVLEKLGIEAFQIKIAPEELSGVIDKFLRGAEVLIVNFPPGLRKQPELDYSGAIRALTKVIQGSGVKKVIFVSSISVYKDTEAVSYYTESMEPNAVSRSGKEIISAEKILLQNPFFETTVIRFGGLIGAGRHPVKYMAGRSGLADPLGPVNLIHLNDCLKIIKKVLENNLFGSVYNAAYPLHPTREEYYTRKATEEDLEVPRFDYSKPSVGKVISSSKVIRELGMHFEEEI